MHGHSLLLCPALWQTLRSQPYKPSASIVNAPKYYQEAVTALLQLCSGYMVYDFVYMIKDNGWKIHPDDVAFIGHHVVTIVYMAHVRVLKAGHISAMTMMFSGEFTNPMQSAHSVTRFAIQMTKADSFWHKVHPFVELVYAVFYALFRAVVGPLQIIHIAYDMFSKEGKKNVPIYISILWVAMLSGIIIGSIPWTMESVDMIRDGLNVKYNETFDYGPRFEL